MSEPGGVRHSRYAHAMFCEALTVILMGGIASGAVRTHSVERDVLAMWAWLALLPATALATCLLSHRRPGLVFAVGAAVVVWLVLGLSAFVVTLGTLVGSYHHWVRGGMKPGFYLLTSSIAAALVAQLTAGILSLRLLVQQDKEPRHAGVVALPVAALIGELGLLWAFAS